MDLHEKKYVWCSQILDQALLHPFDKIRTKSDNVQPVIYRFTINNLDTCKLLNSSNRNNVNIFRNILNDDIINKIIKYYKRLDDENDMGYFEYIEKVFKGEKNYRILLILECINKYLPEDKRFNGYYNGYDQNECAFIDIKNIIVDIVESKYISINFKNGNKEYIFPCTKDIFQEIHSYQPIEYKSVFDINGIVIDKYKMTCNKDIINHIKYESFDLSKEPREIIIYTCKTQVEYYYQQKYLKYKNKYLNLKKII
jgi:hypothetical protein